MVDKKEIINKKWYVVHTKAKSESTAELNLNRQGFHTYLPRVEVLRRQKGTLRPIISPFFPRYLFISLDLNVDNWASVRSTRGACGLVRFDGIPREVPEEFIQALRLNEDSDNLQQARTPSWKEGDVVQIEEGPFSGYSCVFQQVRSNERVAVLLNLVGKQTRAVLSSQDLQVPEFA